MLTSWEGRFRPPLAGRERGINIRLSQIGAHQRQFPDLWYNEKGLNVPGGRQGARDSGNAQRGMRAGGRNQTAQAAGVSLKGKIPKQDNDGDGCRHRPITRDVFLDDQVRYATQQQEGHGNAALPQTLPAGASNVQLQSPADECEHALGDEHIENLVNKGEDTGRRNGQGM